MNLKYNKESPITHIRMSRNICVSVNRVEESNTMEFYFKIPFTEITTTCNINSSLTISQFLEYVNKVVRGRLNINSKYYIEVVDVGHSSKELAQCIVFRDEETLADRYDNINQPIACYVRPVDPITREFTRRNNFSS